MKGRGALDSHAPCGSVDEGDGSDRLLYTAWRSLGWELSY